MAASLPAEGRPSVTRRLARILVAAGIGAVALVALVARTSYLDGRAEALIAADSVVRLVESHASHVLQSANLALAQVSDVAETTDWNDWASIAAAKRRVDRLQASLPFVFGLFVVDRDGYVRVTSLDAPPGADGLAGQDFFEAQRDADAGLFVGGLSRHGQSRPPVFVLSRRIEGQNGAFGGVAAVSLDPRQLASFYRSIELVEAASFYWFGPDLGLLVHEPGRARPQGVAGGAPAELRAAIAVRPGAGSVTYRAPEDGERRTVFYRKVGDLPVHVGVGISHGALLVHWHRHVMPYVAVIGIVLAGLGVLGFFALRWARGEDRYRAALHALNAELEERVASRTRSLTEALMQKDLLFKEVNHRVKNSLQLVSSLLQLQAGTAPEADGRAHLQKAVARVDAIARVHEKLYRTDRVTSIEMGDYLRALCAELGEASLSDGACAVDVGAEPIEVPADKAVPLALIVNELVTNALKHGLPEGGGSETAPPVEVSLERVDPERLRLRVRDRGRGLPQGFASQPRGGLGMTLVQALARQISGELQAEDAGPGSRFTLVFPLTA